MDDILEGMNGVEVTPVPDIREIIPEALPSMNVPEASIRNKAAKTALMSNDPTKITETYQGLVEEAKRGTTGAFTLDQEAQINNSTKQLDYKTIVSILSDPTVPPEQKQKAVEAASSSTFLKESSVNLMSSALMAPSKGEDVRADSARGSLAGSLRELHKSQADIQGLVNLHGASLAEGGAVTVAEAADLYGTFIGTSGSIAGMDQAISEMMGEKQGFWRKFKGFLLAGTTQENIRERLRNLPPEKQVEFSKTVLKAISSNSGTMFFSDNQYAQMVRAQQVFEEGGYTGFDKFLDNVAPLLDVFSLGGFSGTRNLSRAAATLSKEAMLAKSASEASTAIKAGEVPANVIKGAVEAPKGSYEASLRPRTTQELKENVAGFQDKTISRLEDERANLLGVAGNLQEPGNISKMEKELEALRAKNKQSPGAKGPRTDAEAVANNASISRLEQMIQQNRDAANAIQRLDALDKEINSLRAARGAMDVPGGKTYLADVISRIEMNSVVHQSNPASPAFLLQSTNPEKARAALASVVNSADDAIAEGLYGTSRTNAIAGDVFPKAGTESGRVFTKPVDMDITMKYHGDQFTPEELAAAESKYTRDFSQSTEVSLIPGMGSVASREGGGIRITGVYSSPSGPWDNADEAIEQVKMAFRGYGIKDENISVMVKEGLEHVPVDLAKVSGQEGNYLVKIDSFHEIDPTDVGALFKPDVRFNMFDRAPMLVWENKGSVSRWLLDASSMLHPIYTKAAITATDVSSAFERTLLSIATEFSDKFKKLSNPEKGIIDNYFKEANAKGIGYDHADLMSRGFSSEMRDTVKAWRDYWDGIYFLENLDVIRSLRRDGFELLDHKNARLFVKPISKNSNITKVYDPAVDKVVSISKTDMDDLYNMKGTVARLRRPEVLAGEEIYHVIVRQTPGEYTRGLRHSDTALNYREGYYSVRYTAPRWVDQVERNAQGVITKRRAVAVAGDTPSAKQFAESQSRITGVEHVQRADDRVMQVGNDDWWDVNNAQGRVAQRYRGQPINTTKGINVLGDGSFVVDPVSSAIHAARSVAGRTINRPMLEAAKARFVESYKNVLTMDKGVFKFPSSLSEIGAKGAQFTKEVADARTTYEYIRYLENGYINGMDNTVKSVFNFLAEMAGEAGLGRIERGLNVAADMSVSGAAKGSVFMATIAANPIRQWIVQTHQAIRTWAYNPTGMVSGQIPKFGNGYFIHKLGMHLGNEMDEFVKFVDNSGLISAIDRQNLIRGTLADAANLSSNPVGKALNVSRQLGFDAGETINTVYHAAAVYDRYKRLGKNISNTDVMADMHSEIRALSWDMNYAGDMPYNQTTPSVLLQFLQVPHKAMLQAVNRRLPFEVRAKLLLSDMFLWGTPAYMVSEALGGNILPDDPELKTFLTEGFESLLLNQTFKELLHDPKAGFDFSSLAPYDLGGWSKAFAAAVTGGGIPELLANSPIGGLTKEGGRVREALASAARFFGLKEDINPEKPEEFLHVLNEVAKISSGYSNATKAWMALEAKKSFDKMGRTNDDDVRPLEAFMMALGFQDKKTSELFALSQKVDENTKQYKDDVRKDIRNVIRYYESTLAVENTNPEFVKSITNPANFALRKYSDSPVAMQIIQEEIKMAFQEKDTKIMTAMLRASGIPTMEKIRDRIESAPLPEDQKQNLLTIMTNFANARTENESKK